MEQWSNLPLELVEVIESKLNLYLDKIRIRMVCKSWRSHLPILHEHAYILHSPNWDKTKKMHGLFNPIDNKIYEIDPKYVGSKVIRGCSYGWLAFFNDYMSQYLSRSRRKVYLINMFTSARVNLPPTEERHYDVGQQYIRKIVLSSPFADKKDCIAVAIYDRESTVTYCKCGDKTWKYLYWGHYSVLDIIFHEAKLLVLDQEGKLSVFEEIFPSAKPKFVIKISERIGKWAYLVKPSTGGIIAVNVQGYKFNYLPPDQGFELYKIDLINADRVRIYDIGSDNMFLDDTSAMMFSSTGNQGNNIYTIINEPVLNFTKNKPSLSVYNLEKGTLRVFSDPQISSKVLRNHAIWVKMN